MPIIDSYTHRFHPEARTNPRSVGEAEAAFAVVYGKAGLRMPGPEEMLDDMDSSGV